MTGKVVRVAVGVLVDDQQQVLLAKRQANQHQGGLWEFPGGKLEGNEGAFTALQREFLEEVNLVVVAAVPWLTIRHDYSDKSVELLVQRITEFSGKANGREEQLVRWVALTDLVNYSFPEANKPILQKLLG